MFQSQKNVYVYNKNFYRATTLARIQTIIISSLLHYGTEQESEQGTTTGDIATGDLPRDLPSSGPVVSDPPSDLFSSGPTLSNPPSDLPFRGMVTGRIAKSTDHWKKDHWKGRDPIPDGPPLMIISSLPMDG